MKIVIVYDDLAARLRATSKEAGLAAGRGPRVSVRHSIWGFDVLSEPHWRAAAVRAAVEADMIVVSASVPLSLPETIESWLQECLARRGSRTTLLVTLFGQDDVRSVIVRQRMGPPANEAANRDLLRPP